MVVSFESLAAWRARQHEEGKRVVATNGCFDLLHVGHLRYLQEAAALGDSLMVGINDDEGVRGLKGPQRPLNPAAERAELLDALRIVDAVAIFPGERAVEFLRRLRPDVYVKGGDYTLDDLYPPEVEVLREAGSEIRILPLVPERSTSRLIAQVQQGEPQ